MIVAAKTILQVDVFNRRLISRENVSARPCGVLAVHEHSSGNQVPYKSVGPARVKLSQWAVGLIGGAIGCSPRRPRSVVARHDDVVPDGDTGLFSPGRASQFQHSRVGWCALDCGRDHKRVVLQGYTFQDVRGWRAYSGRNLVVIIGALIAVLVNQIFEQVVMHRIAVASGGISTIVVRGVRNLHSLPATDHVVVANRYMGDVAIGTQIQTPLRLVLGRQQNVGADLREAAPSVFHNVSFHQGPGSVLHLVMVLHGKGCAEEAGVGWVPRHRLIQMVAADFNVSRDVH